MVSGVVEVFGAYILLVVMPGGEGAPVVETPTSVLQNVPFPSRLETKGNLASNWKRFCRMWTNYEVASRLIKQPKEERTATLLTCLGPDTLEIVDGLSFASEEERKDVDVVLEKLEAFCVGETNEIYERYQFNKRDQESGESVDSYVATLRTLAKTCNYGSLLDSLIRDRIVVGIRDNGTHKRLLQEPKLTLTRCIDICRSSEATALQLQAMGNHEELKFVSDGKSKSKASEDSKLSEKACSPVILCKFCGKRHMKRREECPAWGKNCNKCGEKNHFAAKCSLKQSRRQRAKPFKQKKKKQQVSAMSDDSSSEEYLLTVNSESVDSVESQKLYARMVINGHDVRFQLDSGATVNILPIRDYKRVCEDPELNELEASLAVLNMYNGTKIRPLGKKRISMRNPKNNRKYNLEFQIVGEENKPLLGASAIQGMQLITVNTQNILVVEGSQSSEGLTLPQVVMQYKDVFEGDGMLEDKLHLHVDQNVKPVQMPARKPPIALKEKYKMELERLVQRGIIAAVSEPTEWISSTVVVLKPNGKLRVCLDPKPLNKALKRNHYPLPTIDDLLPELSRAQVFSVVDVKNGFWHVPLDDESSKLTTFATPWGRFRWLRMPFGISPAPEEFQRRLDEAIEGLDGVRTVADDIIVFGVGDTKDAALRDHDTKFLNLLERCRQKHITLNKDKLKFKLHELSYVGHVISAEGLKPDPAKVEAILDMPSPSDKQGVRRFMGMVNYLQKFAPGLSEHTKPIRDLLKEDVEFVWEESVHGKCFKCVKAVIASAPVLKFFDPREEVVLQCDASQHGLGACLMQNGQPVAYASRSLTSAESNYAQIEKELLAILFGVEKFESYVYGKRFKVETDHKPLESILSKSLLSAPKRLQRMMLRLQNFDFEVEYKRGALLHVADTLSRAYLPCVQIKDPREEVCLTLDSRTSLEKEVESVNAFSFLSVTPHGLARVRQSTEADGEMALLKAIIQAGWPDTLEEVPWRVKDYFHFRDELAVQDGLILKGERLVIPLSMREEVKQKLHQSHLGIQSCLRRGREVVYWPKMGKDIEDFISNCNVCKSYQPNQQKEPMISHEIPTRPWEKVGCDLFDFEDKHYLVCVDYYSDYFELDRICDKKGKEVISKLKSQFARHGIPVQVFSDNGPPFSSKEFQEFASAYEFEHLTSSPRYPQSNGKVENAVKIAQSIMVKARDAGSDPNLSLLDYRNTPAEGVGSSPSQRLFGRRTRTLLPTSSRLLVPETVQGVPHKLKERKAKQTYYYNRGAKELSKLEPGDVVHIKPDRDSKRWAKATVAKEVDIRSYQVRTEDGRTYRRNRRHLRLSRQPFFRAIPPKSPSQQDQSVTEADLPSCPVPISANMEVSGGPTIIQSEPKPSNEPVSRSNDVSSVPVSATSTPAAAVTTTRSGRVVRRPLRYDS